MLKLFSVDVAIAELEQTRNRFQKELQRSDEFDTLSKEEPAEGNGLTKQWHNRQAELQVERDQNASADNALRKLDRENSNEKGEKIHGRTRKSRSDNDTTKQDILKEILLLLGYSWWY